MKNDVKKTIIALMLFVPAVCFGQDKEIANIVNRIAEIDSEKIDLLKQMEDNIVKVKYVECCPFSASVILTNHPPLNTYLAENEPLKDCYFGLDIERNSLEYQLDEELTKKYGASSSLVRSYYTEIIKISNSNTITSEDIRHIEVLKVRLKRAIVRAKNEMRIKEQEEWEKSHQNEMRAELNKALSSL